MDLSIHGKNALVCGSTQGIGKAIAIELANQGANVVLLARNEEKLKKTIGELSSNDDQSHFYLVGDFHNHVSIGDVVEEYVNNSPPFHILINNTGGPAGGPIVKANIDEFYSAYGMHLAVNHILVQSLLPGMKQANYGRIINVISTSVKQPITGLGVSNVTRGAVANWSKTLANEVARYNITVNNVLPGSTETQRIRSIISNRALKENKSETEIEKAMIAQIPMQRFGQAAEIAYTVAFLASGAASYITGINIPVDGGRTKSL